MKVKSPNILMIMVDQQRYDCIGYSGKYPVRTPNIDRLASEGVWFTQAYTPIPICGPARQAFVSGRRPETFGGLWNYNNGLKVSSLDPSEYSWVRDMKALHYRLGYLGKWGVHPTYGPTDYGYDCYDNTDKHYQAFLQSNYPDVKYSSSFFGEKDPLPVEDTMTHWLARRTSEMIERFAEQEEPWLIRVNFGEPHLPCRPAGPFADLYAPEDVPVWGSFGDTFENKPYIQKQQLYSWDVEHFTWEDWAPIVARYYGIISQVDDAIGRIVHTVDQLQLRDDTLVIYTSDHGDLCGGHRMMDKHYVLYDDVVRVPFVMRYPNKIEAGSTCDHFVYNHLDLPPTLLEMLSLPVHSSMQGKSLAPLLQGKPLEDPREHIVCTYNGQQFGLYTQRMIRDTDWKYIWNTTDVDELYDLRNDPNELHNVIREEKHKPIVERFRKQLYDVLLEDGDGLVNNEWMRRQLLHGKKL